MDFFNYLKRNINSLTIILLITNILFVISTIFFLIKYYNYSCDCEDTIALANKDNSKDSVYDTFYVEVKGAVKNPGVYKADSNNIINDIITLAGGFTKNAYTKNINLSRKVSDELVIYIYTDKEYKNNNKTKVITKIINNDECECKTYDISNCIDNSKSEIVASNKDSVYTNSEESNITNSQEEILADNKININTAGIDELIKLSGIGESKAKDIINYRNENGLFNSIEEITKVSGIGNALFEKIKNDITI